MPETVKLALFADDVTLISSHHNKLVAEKELQLAVTAVAEWSTSKKMVLNADKCEVTLFSTNFGVSEVLFTKSYKWKKQR